MVGGCDLVGAGDGRARQIANVALPTIAKDLGACAATSVWIVNAYQLTITVLVLPLAALGDRLGYRRIYIPGLALFTLGSVGCALAHSLTALIYAARVFQGVGAAAIMSMNAALVRATYPTNMLGRGIGYNALVLSISAAAGPTLAAIILSVGSWPWLFLINLPIGNRGHRRRVEGASPAWGSGTRSTGSRPC